ncbi:hypothetical protein Salat_0585700 [Sesamum alatum]|uniref:Reverse transcriptase zinc-binding domain-containing protein n=1 Tax=Sesamum alatum TaxID=300844 RepID=A0AAE1YPX6_9LAMI|nr:hypothetical protein Salat_0585700 [Sesamum alatum]
MRHFQLGVLIGLLWRLMIVLAHLPPLIGQSLLRVVCSFGEDYENLQRRRPEIDQVCVHYGANVDSMKHILLECPFTKIVWALSNIPWHVLEAWSGDTLEWISSVFHKLSKEDQARFLTLCWALWQQRNQALMEGKLVEPLKVVERAIAFLSSYQDAPIR